MIGNGSYQEHLMLYISLFMCIERVSEESCLFKSSGITLWISAKTVELPHTQFNMPCIFLRSFLFLGNLILEIYIYFFFYFRLLDVN